MKRRRLKKQIPQLAHRLSNPTSKYLAASDRVHQDILNQYEREIELVIVDLMRVYLILDSSWPNRRRWLDGLSEEFLWVRKAGMLYGKGQLFWGHWPEVGREITGSSFTVVLSQCARHGIEYVFRQGNDDNVRSYYSRRYCLPHNPNRSSSWRARTS